MPAPITYPREHLARALEAELIGPYELPEDEAPDTSDELLRLPPSRWYLTGLLAPMEARDVTDEPTDDELAAGPDRDRPRPF